MELQRLILESILMFVAPVSDYSKLDSPIFRERQAFARRLEKQWPYSDNTLRAAIRHGKSHHVREMATQILARCQSKAISDAGSPPWADWPLMDANATGWDASKWPWLSQTISRCKPSENTGDPQWQSWRNLSCIWGSDAIAGGCPPSVLKLWFATGRSVDDRYINNAANNFTKSDGKIQ